MGERRRAGKIRLGLLLCVVAAILGVPAVASADFTFCPQGQAAGQCDTNNGAGGIAVDTETGRVFVADWTSERINVFQADGTFLRAFGWGVDTGASKLETCTTASACQAGIAGSGAGQFFAPKWLAVDNTGGPNQGDVYVSDHSYRMQRFDPEGHLLATFGGVNGSGECQFISRLDPIAVGPGGNLYVADTPNGAYGATSGAVRIQRFSPSGTCLGEVKLFEGPSGTSQVEGFAVDSAGNAFVSTPGSPIRKYDPAGNLLEALADSNVSTGDIELDAGGSLYADQGDGDQVIAVYDPTGKIVSRFGYGRIPQVTALAPHHSAGGDVFVSGGQFASPAARYISASPPGPIVAAPSAKASQVGNTKATLKAKVNPEGKATTYHFDYLTEAEYLANGKTFSGAKSTVPAALDFSAGNEFRLRDAEAIIGCPTATKALIEEGKCLTPETEYRFRVVATNEDNPTGTGEGTVTGTFTTKEPLEITALFASEVGSDAATLNAVVNPLGIPATGHFEYVTEAQYEASGFAEAVAVPSAEGEELDFGSGEAGLNRAVTLYPLPPATAYRYRLAVTNPLIEGFRFGEVKTFRTFAQEEAQPPCPNETFRTGPAALLPDCRAYEMVSPLDKANGDIIVLEQNPNLHPAVLNQASVDGERLTYGSYRAFGDAESAPYTSQYLAQRNPLGHPEEGWQTHGISPPQTESIAGSIQFDFEFRAFDEDLCEGWIAPLFEPVLAPGGIPGVRNLYRRTELCEEEAAEAYEAISTAAPEHPEPPEYVLELQGVSEDGTVAAFAANDSLAESGAPPIPTATSQQLYVKGPGEGPRYACVLPEGFPARECSGGTAVPNGLPQMREANVTGALSADGKRLFWTDSSQEGRIYLRTNPLQEQSALAHGGAAGTGTLAEGSNKVTGLTAAAGNAAFTAGSPTATLLETTVGRFVAGQPVSAPGKVPAGTTIVSVAGQTLTLSANATASSASAPISSKGPMPFAVGQTIAAAGIPPGTTIAAVGFGSLTLSANATKSATATPLSATSECTEAAKACTVAVSQAAEEESGMTKSHFWAGAKDGSAAIFTTGPFFLAAGADLYRYEVEAQATSKIAGRVFGILGQSEDLSRVYFASSEVLSGEEENSEGAKAVAGKANLYLYEAGPGPGTYAFIGVLAPDGANAGSAAAARPLDHTSRVSPDGLHAAFMARVPLTGYDNADAKSGKADTEVFVYDATAGEVLCASCNPSGARPAGADLGTAANPSWVAARLPVYSTTLRAPEVLAEDGSRLFFESQDPLVPRDTNSRLDVYEWERLGVGGCQEANASFSAEAGGCVEPVSSGKSKRDSEIVDASATGDDIFFTTLSGLVPQDYGLVDVYDARVGGGFPPPPPPDPGCEGEACQGTPEAPNDPTPASESFQGAGNVREEAAPPVRKPCAKGKVRRHGKCVAARKHKHAHRRAKRNRRAGR